ncbi:hypothetical protein [Oerskovia jenensis]|uniref:hypothetical protein n=1 Tax=Oerskovia jenensis TaxID=162169 RepID=UPI0036DF0F03
MLLRDHAGALEADFQRWYQADLLDLYRGDLTFRKASEWARHLPPGAAVFREMGGPLAWSDEVHMGAAVEYAVRALHWAQTADASTTDPPLPLEPPASEFEERHQQHQDAKKLRTAERKANRFLARQQQQDT